MEIYAQGERWTLYRGDALQILPQVEPGTFDAVVADPPYSSGGFTRSDRNQTPGQKYAQSGSTTSALLPDYSGDNRDQLSWIWWSERWLALSLETTKPGGTVVVWCDWRQIASAITAVQMAGWVWRGVCPWVKPGARPQTGRMTQASEFIVWGSHGAMSAQGNGAYPAGYIKHPAEAHFSAAPFVEARYVSGEDREHMTQKPVPVMAWCLGMVPAGGVVLDPFAGSGSTGVACAEKGLRFVGIEREPAYCEIAARRLRDAYNQQRLF